MKTALAGQIAALAKSPKHHLLEQFASTFGARPTGRSSRGLLALILAHRLQEQALGTLSAATRKRLLRLAKQTREAVGINASKPPRIKAGTRLVRLWKGESHTVEVLERGFEYKGTRYASLTEIADR